MLTDHPDEGTIHAWLDGALDEAASARLAEHVAECPACQAATAEARGLVAGASRVVRALDPVAQGVAAGASGAAWGTKAPVAEPASFWRTLRVTPARAAIAATLLVVAGLTLTHDWVARESLSRPTAIQPVSGTMAAAAARDPLLDSAIRRNVAAAVPPRAVGAAAGLTVPVPEVPPSPAAVADESAPARVAQGRAAAREAAESAPASSDALAASRMAGAATMARRSAAVRAAPAAAECLRVEPAMAGEARPPLPLPWRVTLDSGGVARVATVAGAALGDGSWRIVGDSTVIALRGSDRLALARGDGERPGTLASPAGTLRVVAHAMGCDAR